MQITKDTKICDIINTKFTTLFVLQRYGMKCANCAAKDNESLENCANAHNVNLEDLIEDLNEVIG